MNKKGFTLTEVLAVVVIVVALSLLVVPSVQKTITKNREKLYKELENKMEETTLKYIIENYTDEETLLISKATLMEKEKMSEIYDLKNKNLICNGYVEASNIFTNIQVKAYISCQNYVTKNYDTEKNNNAI